MLQAQADAEDAARYRYLVRNRNYHLIKLFALGDEDKAALDACIDRCLTSEAEILRRQQGK